MYHSTQCEIVAVGTMLAAACSVLCLALHIQRDTRDLRVALIKRFVLVNQRYSISDVIYRGEPLRASYHASTFFQQTVVCAGAEPFDADLWCYSGGCAVRTAAFKRTERHHIA